tara:strand:- start:2224 stop:2745 length:522 start_codon:yes stop_codon:yes gene_type:complete
MIIQCTSCEKKFNVPDSAITAAGRLVQCSSCGNKWTQYPIKVKPVTAKSVSAPIKTTPKKKINKKKNPVPYSKEYMQEKWGTSIQSYALEKGLSKKRTKKQKVQKQKILKETKVGFGFFNYIITYSILFTFLVGILNFERGRLARKFPFLEPYIDHFFESLEIFKVLILDFFR